MKSLFTIAAILLGLAALSSQLHEFRVFMCSIAVCIFLALVSAGFYAYHMQQVKQMSRQLSHVAWHTIDDIVTIGHDKIQTSVYLEELHRRGTLEVRVREGLSSEQLKEVADYGFERLTADYYFLRLTRVRKQT